MSLTPKAPMFLVPLEPVQGRYTESWYRNFPSVFEKAGFEVVVIDGQPLTSKIEVGSFLDINSTIAYKNSQMAAIARLFHERRVPQGAHFYFMDVEFWGIESLRLMADMNKVDIVISGFLHAASYTVDDAFAVAAPYQRFTEVGWIEALDAVFVGSEYHKDSVIERRLKPLGMEHLSQRIHVFENPVFADDYVLTGVPKKKQVILPNRVDWGKRPDLSFAVAALFKQEHPDWEFVITTGKDTLASDRPWLSKYAYWLQDQGVLKIMTGCSKALYHQTMEESAVMLSSSIEENFGYCIAEALFYGTVPVLRSGLSHAEFDLDPLLYFIDEDEALNALEFATSRAWDLGTLRDKIVPSLGSLEQAAYFLRALGPA